MNEKSDFTKKSELSDRPGHPRGHGSDCALPPDLARLPATLVREARPVYGDPGRLEQLRLVAEDGLPVDSVKVLQAELKRFGVRRPSEFVNRIAPARPGGGENG